MSSWTREFCTAGRADDSAGDEVAFPVKSRSPVARCAARVLPELS